MVQPAKLSTLIFYFFLSLIFVFEGFGWRGGREASFALILVMPLFLFLLDFILQRKIEVPKVPTILYSGFIFFSAISTIFSLDIGRSFPYLLFYIALYGVFLYVYNHQEELKRYLIPFIFIFSVVFCIYALFANYLIGINYDFFYPEWGYQFVYSRFGSHNHLGNFLIIPMVISFYKIFLGQKMLFNYFSLLYFLPFFILSFSRSAYLTLIVTLLFMFSYLGYKRLLKINPVKIILTIFVLVLSGILFFSTTVDFKNKSITSNVHSYLVDNFSLQEKTFISKRTNFINDASDSVRENPLFGVGPLNYSYISQKFTDFPGFYTDTSHNLFLDVFSENGILAGIFFFLFLSFLFKFGQKSIFFFVCLAMIMNFQTMYTYRIYSFFFLFFIAVSMCCKVNEER